MSTVKLCAPVLVLALVAARQGYSADTAKKQNTVPATLADDGRIGKVIDVQGVVTLRSLGQGRGCPIVERVPVRPGDLVQTELQGAHAVTIKLLDGGQVVIGPGSTLELASPRELRFTAGEIKIKTKGAPPFVLVGPDGAQRKVDHSGCYRADRRSLVALEKDPAWLQSYEGRASGESLGSLLARIDGRDVPLTVGYHKVSVDIQDQIARTTIEESFVNQTESVLEGTFCLPLPQDASIAGFGMWIGDELIEADVVEKQRAREIL